MTLRRLCLISAAFMALSSGTADAGPDGMSAEEARHLLSRTGFGASLEEIADLTGKSYAEGVDRIMAGLDGTPHRPMPDWARGWAFPRNEIYALGQTMDELFVAHQYFYIEELSAWWLGEMIETPSPLQERMTLFWHDHFAVSFIADENAQWMANQNSFLRSHATGSFADLASGILRDPAMLSYLSNTENFAEDPNENLAREYLELFTLGQGRGYSERDVKEVARALTGHSVAEFGGGYAFYADDHDSGPKEILGLRKRFGASDLPGLVMGDPNFGPYIVEKLWREFISEAPDAGEVTRFAQLWRTRGWAIKPLLRAMFLSDAFWDAGNRGRLVKSPVELLVGAVRSFGLGPVDLGDVSYASAEMGQALFFPPNVAGWSGGADWITDAAALTRAAIMREIVEFEAEEEAALRAPMTMRMAGGSAASDGARLAAGAGPQDLRVGQVFALHSERIQEDGAIGTEAVLSLFDVSFGGRTWRSFPIFIEHYAEEEAFLAIHLGDCDPGCPFAPQTRAGAEDGWIEIPLERAARGGSGDAAAQDFLAALLGHLPALLATTKPQPLWQPDPELAAGEEDRRASYSSIARLTESLQSAGQSAFGTAPGRLFQGPSAPGRMGLEGMTELGSIEDLDAYLEAREETARRAFASGKGQRSSLSAWIHALPEAVRAPGAMAAHIMALAPAQAPGDADADPDEMLRALLMSPHFQLN